jgi:uroporphyrinogen-III decarboxylase
MSVQIRQILDKIECSKNINPDGEKKISQVLKGGKVNTLPLIFWKPRHQTVPGWTYNMNEQFYDKEKMLYAHLEEILDSAKNIHDSVVCLRPNFGTIFIPAILGLSYKVPTNTFAWLTSHLSKNEIKKLSFPDLDYNPMMQRAKEYMQYFQETVPSWIHVYLPDTQGPFDIAHAILGQEIFLAIYDEPELVHDLLDFSTKVYIEVTKRLKKIINEPMNSCYHGHALARGIFMSNGGTRISEDSATLLSPEHIEEFVIPYDCAALKSFGGGFIHYCGKHEYLLEAYLNMKEVRAINLGNPESYNFTKSMDKFLEYKKVYFGIWPKKEKENIYEYIKRIKGKTEDGTKGMLLHFDESMFPDYSSQEILDIWRDYP